MTAQLAVAGLIGVAIWSLMAMNLAPVPEAQAYWTEPNGAQPAVLVIRCDNPRKRFPCKVKEQIEMVKRVSQ